MTTAVITRPDAVSTVPTMVRGDWVLFHPVYKPEELKAVEVLHREAKSLPDKMAYSMVKLARTIFDLVSMYKHVDIPATEKMTVQELRAAGRLLDDRAWLNDVHDSEETFPLLPSPNSRRSGRVL
ncbi:hypothetical protein C0991_006400 [Blastosporella zonata]|nr:hypothetical protein C0991_006400 [Blastosporella zonata]